MDDTWTRRLLPMLRARHFDEVLLEHVALLVDHYHVSIGQEAAAAAISLHRSVDDPFLVNYRNHAHLVSSGADVTQLYGELFSRDLGPQRGRSGSFHLSDPPRGFPHTSALVAGSVPLACGVAWSRKRSGRGGVVFTNFGEGALGEGVVHECFNIAALWELPVVFVCESNQEPADGQANSMQSASSLVDIAGAHNVDVSYVDATRPVDVDAVVGEVVTAVRARSRPWFLQAQTHAWPGNDTFYPENVTGSLDLARAWREEPDPWHSQDAVLNEVRWQRDHGTDPGEMVALSESVRHEMVAALETALQAPLAPTEAARLDVWAP